MRGVYQHHTSRLGILGVQPEHVYGEGDFVGDALAGRLSLGPEFKVAPVVLISLAIQVVYHFIWRQFAAKFLFKNEAMFQHFAPFYAMLVRKTQANVALAGYVALYLARLGWAKALMFGKLMNFPAIGNIWTAKSISVVGCSVAVPNHRDGLTANDARIPFGTPPPLTAALTRTVKRVFVKFGAVTAKMARFNTEWLSAVGAGKFYGRDNHVLAAIGYLVSAVAGMATILSVGIFRFHGEAISAINACQRYRHLSRLVFATSNQYTAPLAVASGKARGVA